MHPSSTYTPEAELVERSRAGDPVAFAELLRRHDDRMRGLAFRLLADRQAMDGALRAAYLRASRSLGHLRRGADVGAWLYRVTYNACVDHLRDQGHDGDRAAPVDRRADSEGTAPFGAAEAVRSALAELPVSQRVAVVLVDGEGFDHRAAAEVLGVAPGTVASRVQRARARLRLVLTAGVQ